MTAVDDTWVGAILDSYAVLEYLEDGPGASAVQSMLESSRATKPVLISWVNMGEVLYVVRRRRGADAADLVLAALDQLPLETVDAGRALTLTAARLKSHYPISYADAFCAALSKLTGLPAVTGDPEFRALAHEIDVVWL